MRFLCSVLTLCSMLAACDNDERSRMRLNDAPLEKATLIALALNHEPRLRTLSDELCAVAVFSVDPEAARKIRSTAPAATEAMPTAYLVESGGEWRVSPDSQPFREALARCRSRSAPPEFDRLADSMSTEMNEPVVYATSVSGLESARGPSHRIRLEIVGENRIYVLTQLHALGG